MFCLDLSAAFDTIDHEPLIIHQKHVRIRGDAAKMIQSYLSGGKQSVKVNGARLEQLLVETGIPQSSLLRPIIFNLYLIPLKVELSNICR